MTEMLVQTSGMSPVTHRYRIVIDMHMLRPGITHAHVKVSVLTIIHISLAGVDAVTDGMEFHEPIYAIRSAPYCDLSMEGDRLRWA